MRIEYKKCDKWFFLKKWFDSTLGILKGIMFRFWQFDTVKVFQSKTLPSNSDGKYVKGGVKRWQPKKCERSAKISLQILPAPHKIFSQFLSPFHRLATYFPLYSKEYFRTKVRDTLLFSPPSFEDSIFIFFLYFWGKRQNFRERRLRSLRNVIYG